MDYLSGGNAQDAVAEFDGTDQGSRCAQADSKAHVDNGWCEGVLSRSDREFL